MKIIWTWKPNSYLGLIKLGEPLSIYMERWDLIEDEDVDQTDWVRYKLPKSRGQPT